MRVIGAADRVSTATIASDSNNGNWGAGNADESSQVLDNNVQRIKKGFPSSRAGLPVLNVSWNVNKVVRRNDLPSQSTHSIEQVQYYTDLLVHCGQ